MDFQTQTLPNPVGYTGTCKYRRVFCRETHLETWRERHPRETPSGNLSFLTARAGRIGSSLTFL
jgi:hypothetical protein